MNVRKIIMLLMLNLAFVLFSCDKKNDEDARKSFYGEGSKTWHATRETNAAGKKDKLTDAEKQDVMRFNSDGSFSMNTAEGNGEGTWTYDPSAKALSLQFAAANVTETFQVSDLSDDKIKLKAPDGSTLTLESD